MDFLKYLFRNATEYSDFNIFGLAHITILFIGILGIVFILKRMNVSRKFERILGIVLLAQQIILYTWYLRSGYKLLTEGLPLYHCRIAIILTGIGLFLIKAFVKNRFYMGVNRGSICISISSARPICISSYNSNFFLYRSSIPSLEFCLLYIC